MTQSSSSRTEVPRWKRIENWMDESERFNRFMDAATIYWMIGASLFVAACVVLLLIAVLVAIF